MGFMSRKPGEPRNQPTVGSGVPEGALIPGETCDKCNASPRHRVVVPLSGSCQAGQLLFCTHHYERLAPALAAAGLKAV